VEGEGECVKIIRLEDATLDELVASFIDLTSGFMMPAGSVVVLASASHLAWVGTAAYAADFVKCKDKLMGAMRGGVEVVHGFPLLMCGTDDRELIRSIIDIEQWLNNISTGRDIRAARRAHIEHTMGSGIIALCSSVAIDAVSHDVSVAMCSAGSTESSAHRPMNLMLPVNLSGHSKAVFHSPGYKNLPDYINPCQREVEKQCIDALVLELNESYNTDLAIEYCSSRQSEPVNASEKVSNTRYVVCGTSHSVQLANALDDLEVNVVDISCPGWKISADSVEEMRQQLVNVLKEHRDGTTVIIYQLFDNSWYMAINEAGEKAELEKNDTDGKYHVPGKLGYAGRPEVKSLFSLAVPLLRAGLLHQKVILTPLMRYLVAPCCNNPSHLINKTTDDYGKEMANALVETEGWLRDQAYMKRIKNYVVMCPNRLLGLQGSTMPTANTLGRLWQDNPVHMTGAGYQQLAEDLLEALVGAKFTRPVEPQAVSSVYLEHKGGWPMSQHTDKRKAWVKQDDVLAQRGISEDIPQGSRRGGHYRGHRGHNRGGGRGFRGHKGAGGRMKGARGGKYRPY
jgi:hypothetical protein